MRWIHELIHVSFIEKFNGKQSLKNKKLIKFDKSIEQEASRKA